VFWSEFDSRELLWLQYLFAPMQDGRFEDGQLNHAIGKCVFIFADGTSRNFAKFTPTRRKKEARFGLRKGPDFVSRLNAFIDVLGPNPRDPDDAGYRLRRAFRAYLGCGASDRVDFDPDLLHARLRVQKYRHGARPLEKLIGNCAATIRSSSAAPI
jgi:hypothetical protein